MTNKVSFMFNGIKKYVVRIVCVIMLLLVQFDVCAPLIDANLAMVETMEQPTLPSDNNEESRGEETYYFQSGRAQLPNSRFFTLHYRHAGQSFLLFPKFRYKVTHLSVKIRGKWYIITLSFVCTAFNMSH
ncbi:MAG: hypothetical protein ACLVEE_14410 [Phocaeicola vulgatus]